MPLWTASMARTACSIQAKVKVSARRWRSARLSMLRTRSACARLQQQDVLEQAGEGAEEGRGFGLALGAGAVGLGHAEEGGVVLHAAGVLGGVQDGEGVVAGRGVFGEVEADGAAGGSFAEAGGELALGLVELGAALGEEGGDLVGGQGSEVRYGAAGADGGEQLAEVLGEEEDVDVGRRLLQDFQEGVGCLLHEGRGGDDEDLGAGFGGKRSASG